VIGRASLAAGGASACCGDFHSLATRGISVSASRDVGVERGLRPVLEGKFFPAPED
jgi:hypothetical protein